MSGSGVHTHQYTMTRSIRSVLVNREDREPKRQTGVPEFFHPHSNTDFIDALYRSDVFKVIDAYEVKLDLG